MRFFASSKTCNVCLNKVDRLDLDLRAWTCDKCQTHHDRDINAAINIRNEALRILDLGIRSTANGGNVRQPGKTSVLLDAVPNEIGSQHPLRLSGQCLVVHSTTYDSSFTFFIRLRLKKKINKSNANKLPQICPGSGTSELLLLELEADGC